VRAATGKMVRGNNRITPLGGSIGTTWTRASWRGRGAGGTLLCGLSSAWALLSCLPRGVVEASTCGSKMDLYETRRRRWRTPPTLTKKGQGKGNGACCTPIELGISCGSVIYCRANTTDRCIIASASNLHAYSRPLVLFVRARAADTDSKTGDDGRSRGLTISHAVDYGPPGGCSNACHACSWAEHPGGSELACCVVDFVQGQNTCRCATTGLRHEDAAMSDGCATSGSGISWGCEMFSRGRCTDGISTCFRAARCACSRRLMTLLVRRGWAWHKLGPPRSGGKRRCRPDGCFCGYSWDA